MATAFAIYFLPLRNAFFFKLLQTLSCLFQTRTRSNSTNLSKIYISVTFHPQAPTKKTVQDLRFVPVPEITWKKDRFPFERIPVVWISALGPLKRYPQVYPFWFKPCQKPYEIPQILWGFPRVLIPTIPYPPRFLLFIPALRLFFP